MSPQRSNREQLIEGTLRCLEKLPPQRITARAIASEAGANVASITYHFGSKDQLLTEAAIAGLDRWLEEVARGLEDIDGRSPATRLLKAAEIVESGGHTGLVRNYVAALGKAPHDERLRATLAKGFERSRPAVAAVLGLGKDRAGQDAAGLVLSMFHGLLIQRMLDSSLGVEGRRMRAALARLATILPDPGGPPAQELTRPDPDTGPSTFQ